MKTLISLAKIRNIKRDKRIYDQQGFTIIELLIATMVFSVILLLVTYGILQIGRTYYKGVTETKTQQAARKLIDTIGQDIQFNSGSVIFPTTPPPLPNPYAFCVGDNRYTVFQGTELIDDNTHHALVQDNNPGCTGIPIIPAIPGMIPSTAKELLPPNMRIAVLNICVPGGAVTLDCPSPPQAGSNLYVIHVRIVYGVDTDLSNPSLPSAACQGGDTNQFCAVSDLTTTVQKRKS